MIDMPVGNECLHAIIHQPERVFPVDDSLDVIELYLSGSLGVQCFPGSIQQLARIVIGRYHLDLSQYSLVGDIPLKCGNELILKTLVSNKS